MELLENVVPQRMDHHGIVAGVAKHIKFVELVDEILPKTAKNSKVSHGQALLAIIINGFGFFDRRLYSVKNFFEDLPVEELLGKGIQAEDLNDDLLGNTLDAIHRYGVSRFYTQIGTRICFEQNLVGKHLHLDTSSKSLKGYYKKSHDNPPVVEGKTEEERFSNLMKEADETGDLNNFHITYGHSKDHRPDLKQVILSLITTSINGVPLWMQGHSGNTSDKKAFDVAVRSVLKYLEDKEDRPIWVADAAIYSKQWLKDLGKKVEWVTRVPETIGEAKLLLSESDAIMKWEKIDDNYKMCAKSSRYGGLVQRWLVLFSKDAYKREHETFEKKNTKNEIALSNKVPKIKKKGYLDKETAREEIFDLKKKYPLFKFEYNIRKKTIKNKVIFQTNLQYEQDHHKYLESKNRLGKFILATNIHNKEVLPDKDILETYKGQSSVESKFKLCKDPSFGISDVFLKKSERIQALMAVMTFNLLIYSIAETWIRSALEKSNETIKNLDNKKVKNPTMKMIFKKLSGITLLKIIVKGKIKTSLCHLSEEQKKILALLGPSITKVYGFT